MEEGSGRPAGLVLLTVAGVEEVEGVAVPVRLVLVPLVTGSVSRRSP